MYSPEAGDAQAIRHHTRPDAETFDFCSAGNTALMSLTKGREDDSPLRGLCSCAPNHASSHQSEAPQALRLMLLRARRGGRAASGVELDAIVPYGFHKQRAGPAVFHRASGNGELGPGF